MDWNSAIMIAVKGLSSVFLVLMLLSIFVSIVGIIASRSTKGQTQR